MHRTATLPLLTAGLVPAAVDKGSILVFVDVFVIWIISLCLHEYAHARVAYAGGDTSVAAKGYLSLNPFRYLDPMLSIVWPLIILVIGGIGLPGGAVWIDASRLRSRGWRTGVSLAGPAANLIMCILLGAPFLFGLHESGDPRSFAWPVLAFACYLQATAFVLNLLPLPGLDGYGALEPWLPFHVVRELRPYARYAPLLLLILFKAVTPFADFFYATVTSLLEVLDVPREYIYVGFNRFRFWE